MNLLCSIFFHNYYGEQKYWLNYLSKNLQLPSTLYYNKVEESIYNVLEEEKRCIDSNQSGSGNLGNIIFRKSPNKGKDIGGKLVLLDAYLKLDRATKYGLFLHDKKSPYKGNSDTWADSLLKIADYEFSQDAIKTFSDNPEVGIITAKGNVRDEFNYELYSFTSTNKILLPKLQKQFNIFPASFEYVAGTMFWFRLQPFHVFFNQHSPLKIRSLLETGNVTDAIDGSYTHSWERLLSWIITSQGYKIKAI